MDLNKMVMQSLSKMEAEGKIEEIVDKHVTSTVESIVSDTFGNWSDFSKNLKKQVSEKLQVNFDGLDLTTYNTLIMKAVEEKLGDSIATEGVARINESIEDLLKVAKPEYKLSELVKEMADEVDDMDMSDDAFHEMTMEIDKSYSLAIISLDPEPGVDKYECKYRFWFDERTGKISNVEIKDSAYRKARKINEFDARAILYGFHGLEGTLFKMYAAGSKLILDEDDVDQYVSNPSYHD